MLTYMNWLIDAVRSVALGGATMTGLASAFAVLALCIERNEEQAWRIWAKAVPAAFVACIMMLVFIPDTETRAAIAQELAK